MLRALNHPVRRRVLRALVDGKVGSATTLSRELGLSLGVTSYHLNKVLAGECDVVELVDSVPRRGAIEKFYRLKVHALGVDDPDAGEGTPGAPRKMSREDRFILEIAAMDVDAIETLEGNAPP
jgi:DNA-binding transcriptional ArsR family regulator